MEVFIICYYPPKRCCNGVFIEEVWTSKSKAEKRLKEIREMTYHKENSHDLFIITKVIKGRK